MKIPFVDLKPATERIRPAYLKMLDRFLKRADFILTKEVDDFEKKFAQLVGVKYAIGISSGSDALYLSLLALGIGAGDEVIIQANAYNASVTAILRTGAVPRFADIEPEKMQLDLDSATSLINTKTKAILPVHMFGQLNNMPAIMALAKKHNLFVLEDCAQACGSVLDKKMAGSFGDLGAFSFYPTKNLGAFVDAGAITTSDPVLADKIKKLRNLGQASKNDHQLLGFNMRLDPMQALVLSLKLKNFKTSLKNRQVAALYYDQLIIKSNLPVHFLPTSPAHSHHLYMIDIGSVDRAVLQKKLLQKGVATGLYYPVLVYDQPFFQGEKPICPVAEKLNRQLLALPFFEGITSKQQAYVVKALAHSL